MAPMVGNGSRGLLWFLQLSIHHDTRQNEVVTEVARTSIQCNLSDGNVFQHVNLTIRPHSEHAETEPSAKVAKPCVVFTPLLARRKASGEPNFVTCGSAIDPLQNELEVEGQLELANHDDRRIIAPQRQQIAASDLTFDNEAEPFEEGLDWPIEQRLQNRSPGSSQLEPSFARLRLQSLKRRIASSSDATTTEAMLRTRAPRRHHRLALRLQLRG